MKRIIQAGDVQFDFEASASGKEVIAHKGNVLSTEKFLFGGTHKFELLLTLLGLYKKFSKT